MGCVIFIKKEKGGEVMPKNKNDHRAWKPKQISFYTSKGINTFKDVIDVFTSKLSPNCVAFIDQEGRMFVTNLPFVVYYERVAKEKGSKENGEKRNNSK